MGETVPYHQQISNEMMSGRLGIAICHFEFGEMLYGTSECCPVCEALPMLPMWKKPWKTFCSVVANYDYLLQGFSLPLSGFSVF